MTQVEMMTAMITAAKEGDWVQLDLYRNTVNDWLAPEDEKAAFQELANFCEENMLLER